VQVALQAIRTLLAGGGYEPTALDMHKAFDCLTAAATNLQVMDRVKAEVEKMLATDSDDPKDLMREALLHRIRI